MIVETGERLNNADSYVSIEYADTYFTARGFSSWFEKTDEDKEIELIKATEYVDASFDWRGRKATAEQALAFPRKGLIDNDGFTVDGIPAKIMQTVCDAVMFSATFSVAEENGAVTSERVGSISVSYDVSKKERGKTLYDAINLKLKGLYIDRNKKGVYSIEVQRT